MDYIQSKLMQKIEFYELEEDLKNLSLIYQTAIEYCLILILGYLWNYVWTDLNPDEKEESFKLLKRPTIGTIISICRMLDKNKQIISTKYIKKIFDQYPKIRNDKIGHGYIYEDEIHSLLEELKVIFNGLKKNVSILSSNIDYIKVIKKEDTFFKGINYKSGGNKFLPWSCSDKIYNFIVDSIYICIHNRYYRVSPFIEIADEESFYIYRMIKEPLTGKIQYNRLLKSGIFFKEWNELSNIEIESDGERKRSPNGTIINLFDKNFSTYIDIGIKDQLKKFLLKNHSSVCATVWGHGGVGKTATVQSLSNDLAYEHRRYFDYIIFLSAKDRYYNFYTGTIEYVHNHIDSLDSIVKRINIILGNENHSDINAILKFDGNILIIIDDFETFSSSERLRIKEFVGKLNINHHKVLVTTRLFDILGEEFKTNELNPEDTINFLLRIIENEHLNIPKDYILSQLTNSDLKRKIFEITSGRPLFIYQLAFLLDQNKDLNEVVNIDIKSSKTAIDFLYGKIYDQYLSETAKNIFVVMSLLVSEKDLSNVIEKIIYILNLEHDRDQFFNALYELEKLKIIKVDENKKFFEVYSREIYQIMFDYYHKMNQTFKRLIKSRINQVNKDKHLDNEHALLQSANESRLTKNEEEVISSYRQILNRVTSPQDVKLQAILNLSAYLIDRGKREQALQLLDEYSTLFANQPQFIKMHATYYWANGTESQRKHAVDILSQYRPKDGRFDLSIKTEIAGLLLTYTSILLLTDWNKLNSLKIYGDISIRQYKQLKKEQRQKCKDIHRSIGVHFFNYIRRHDFSEFSPGARQNINTSLYQFIDICLRINKIPLINDICEYMIHKAPSHFHGPFLAKQNRYCSKIDRLSQNRISSKDNDYKAKIIGHIDLKT